MTTRIAAHPTEAGVRADAYWFLASLFAAPPGDELLHRLVGAPAEGERPELARELLAPLEAGLSQPGFAERLATEHARLFLGLRQDHGPPPPFESLWREGRMLGESTLEVAQAYLEAGFQDQGPWGPCDHIVHELRFLASLCHAEAEALETDQPDEAAWSRERRMRFVERHLMAWMPAYGGALAEQAREPFYRALGRITAELISQEAQSDGEEVSLAIPPSAQAKGLSPGLMTWAVTGE